MAASARDRRDVSGACPPDRLTSGGRPPQEADSDEELLRAYHQLRRMIAWLKVPLDDPSVSPPQQE
ncbi:DUF6027 family protein [Streptomyces cupreus]|uniref:DUF6027 family protein n=1 Tax=Streptomyces cupreus TaxID=2759956 RepID=UPI003AB98BD5